MAAHPRRPCRKSARGNAGERLNSKFASALSSANFQSGNWRSRKPEALPKDQTAAALAEIRAGAAIQIEQKELSFAAAKALDDQFQAPGTAGFDLQDAASQIARAVPDFQSQPRAADLKGEIIARKREQFLARFQQSRLTAIFEETLN